MALLRAHFDVALQSVNQIEIKTAGWNDRHHDQSFPTTMQKPTVTMTGQTLPRRVDPCLDARQVLQGAIQKGLKLEPAASAALARLQ